MQHLILECILDQKKNIFFRTTDTNSVRSVDSVIALYQRWLPDGDNSTVVQEKGLVTRKSTVQYLVREGAGRGSHHVCNL